MISQKNRRKTKTDDIHIMPLLRWAGGKRFLVSRLKKFVPSDYKDRVYHEPFLGSASLFFSLHPERSVLSDANEHLINCYKYVRDNPILIADYLKEHGEKNSEKYYYEVRDIYNRSKPSVAQAARFIYLNRTCFNGIFRVNLSGKFNVPYGWKDSPILPDRTWLRNVSNFFKKATLNSDPFEKTLTLINADDFVYLDPPYPPLNGTSYFTHYTKDRFVEEDQRRLAEMVHCLNDLRCYIGAVNLIV